MFAILIALTIVTLMVFIYYNSVKNIRLSALSYKKINSNVPQKEMLDYFLENKASPTVKNFINARSHYKTSCKPVYAIKKYSDSKYEFELYFYRYQPDRDSHLFITLDSLTNFPSAIELDNLNPAIRKCKQFIQGTFIICSVDINDQTIASGNSNVSFYYGPDRTNPKYPYYILEENITTGDIIKTNEYGLITDTDRKLYSLVDTFCEPHGNEIIFFAIKPLKKTKCIYIENMGFNAFVTFLKYFGYPADFIAFCQNMYSDKYKFCVSYDIRDEDNSIAKTTIFSILN